jgi:hypothetical protein
MDFPPHWRTVFTFEEIPTIDQIKEKIELSAAEEIRSYITQHEIIEIEDIIQICRTFSELSPSTIRQYLERWGDTDQFPFGWSTVFTLPDLPQSIDEYVQMRLAQFKQKWPDGSFQALKDTNFKEYNRLVTSLENTVGVEYVHKFTGEPRVIMEKIQKLKAQGIDKSEITRKDACRYLSAEPTHDLLKRVGELFPFIDVSKCKQTAQIIIRRVFKRKIQKRARDKASAAIYLTHKFLTQSECVFFLKEVGYPTTTTTLRRVLKDIKLQRKDESQFTEDEKKQHVFALNRYNTFLESKSDLAEKLKNVKCMVHTHVPGNRKKAVTCAYCGKLFLRYRNRVTTHNFCSYSCLKKWQKTRWDTLTCTHCGDTFKKLHSRVRNSEDTFCSLDCFQNWIQAHPKEFRRKTQTSKQTQSIKEGD